jgi:hypothetical protein
MHAGSFILDGERVDIRAVPAEGFSDPIYLDDLTVYFDGGLYRVWPSERYPSRGSRKLHREVWKAAFGPVPAGCHIHHRDGNIHDARVANLECLPSAEHLKKARARRSIEFSAEARQKAAEWHASPEGRLWHSRHAKQSANWTKWKREPRLCLECGKEYSALVRENGRQHLYCCTPCKAIAYRKRQKARGAE